MASEGSLVPVWVAVVCSLALFVPVSPQSTAAPPKRRVTIPPLIIDEPPKMVPFREEESIEMPCVATGEPQPTYYWKMNEKDFDPSGNDGRIAIQPGVGTLIFARPLDRDEAIYQCFAENQVGIALTVKIDLRQAYLEPFQSSGTASHRPNIGESLKLRCVKPRSFPPADIFWATISTGERFTPIDLTNRVTMDPEGNLYFVNIQQSDYNDGRKYACIVQNKVMRSIQQGEYALVQPQGQTQQYFPPSILWMSPTHQVALRSGILRIKCIFAGNPTPKVDWNRIGAEMPPRYRQESFGQELVVEDIQLEDEGKYECQGISGESSVPIRRSFDLSVEAAPYWETRPDSIDGAEGDTAVFVCKALGKPVPVNFWFINGIPDTKLPEDPRRVREPKTMTFYNLTKADAQVIQCNSTNKHGYVYANAYLNVLTEPPQILDPPLQEQKVAEGQTIQLSCRVFGSPRPLVVWHKGSEQLTGGRFKVMDTGNLEITEVSMVDAGLYLCTATNKFDTVSASGSLVVRRMTEIQTRPLDVMVYEGTEAKFTCTATTDPQEVLNLQVDWKKDGQMIDYLLAQRVFKNDMDNSLTISGTMSLDTGKYTCIATNGLDESEASAQLIVQAPPDPPANVWVNCQPTNNNNQHNMVEVNWTPGRENYAPILNFVIQFNTTFNADTWYDIETNVSQNFRNKKVILSPYGNYTFRVLARNKIGISQPSQHTEKVCKTEPDLPDKNPENVMGEGDEPNNLVIFWTPMPKIEQNGGNFKYIISYQRMDMPGKLQTYTQNNPDVWYHEVLLDDGQAIPTYKPYRVQVKAKNEIGDAKVEPEWVVGYSGEGVPLTFPSNVAVDPDTIGSNSATLRWAQVDTSPVAVLGFFRGYRVQFAKLTEWPDNIREADFIFNETYRYPRPRGHYTGRYKRALGSAPGDNAPTGDDTHMMLDAEAMASQVTVSLTNLPPNSYIKVQVRVLNKYYTGPPSTPIEFQTKEGQPGPPAAFEVLALGPTHFDMVWDKPYEPNGVLVGYSISYQAITGLNLGRLKYRQPITDPEQTSATLTGLTPDSYYRVYLSAATAEGVGEQIFLDMKSAPPGPPSPPTIAITGLNETWVNVSWVPSVTGTPGSVFYVEYRVKGLFPWQRSPDEYLNHYMEIIDLEMGTIYQTRVTGKNGVGDEAASEWLDFRTGGAPQYNFTVGTAGWFYGIWISLLVIIALVIAFFFAKRHADDNFNRNEEKIETMVRQIQAEEVAKEMGMMGTSYNDTGSREFMNTSPGSDVYNDGVQTYSDIDEEEEQEEDDPFAEKEWVPPPKNGQVPSGQSFQPYNDIDEKPTAGVHGGYQPGTRTKDDVKMAKQDAPYTSGGMYVFDPSAVQNPDSFL